MMSKSPRRPLLAGLASLSVALLAACAEMPTDTGAESRPTPEPQQPAQPAQPATPEPGAAAPFFTGAYLGDASTTPERIGGAIAGFERLSGKRPALVKSFHDLDCDFTASGWCGRLLREVEAAGSTNYLALDVRWAGGPQASVLEAINQGKADARLTAIARGIRSVGDVVLLEPAWEMNGNWSFAWQGVENGNAAGPAKYAAAWRRIVDVFRREGATNVRWVWNPNVGNPLTHAATGAGHWNWYANYYPGDAYVDYVGAHGFNAPKVWGGSWQSFTEMTDGDAADRMLSDLLRRYPHKPVLIGEFGTDEGTGDAKARWIREAYATMRARGVAGAVWFHMDKEADWRIDSTPAALAAFREAMAQPGIQTAYAPAAPAGNLLAAR